MRVVLPYSVLSITWTGNFVTKHPETKLKDWPHGKWQDTAGHGICQYVTGLGDGRDPNAIISKSVSYVLMSYHPLSEMEVTRQ